MEEILGEIAAAATGGTIAAAVLIWLTRSWISERLKGSIKSEYDEKLETIKAELKARSDIELERLRSQLKQTATEHEVRFARLHERRAEIIAETYASLKELYIRLGEYVKPFEPAGGKSRDERRVEAAKTHENFRAYYSRRLIFFPKEIADKLEHIDAELMSTANDFFWKVELIPTHDSTTSWIKISERVRGEMKIALVELENEFRRLLGAN